MAVELAERLKKLPPYLFAQLDEAKARQLAKGVDVIDLGVGDPDLPTPKPIIDRMKEAVENPEHHRYPSYEGMLSFREAVARWYKSRFGVELDPATEVITLIGSKEGIGHVPLAFVNPGEVVLVPDPGYPVYGGATILAGGEPYNVPLVAGRGFLPDFSAIHGDVLAKARLMFLNYPNNPTAAVAPLDFFKEAVEFAREHGIILCHDAAYSEMYYGEPPHSLLEVEGAKEVAVEFHSLSKTFNMTGWRIGMAVGNAAVVQGLKKVKTNIDSGAFQAVQEAGIEALVGEHGVEEMRQVYKERRDVLVEGLKSAGFQVEAPQATFYVWFPVPGGSDSITFATRALEEVGVVITPGVGFGVHGEGYVRAALTVSKERLEEAAQRLARLMV
ncbi:MAG TPA: LL-diaminopimelate aminotransferase [Thermosulfidibacter takaii]|uniref:Aminotransferase n=1 Tax=Thermosulfidibacter takaii TaxID=412593 RepID=A0A7C0U6M4_9BACT|nr:LL-diaminopimelate aminotransferase [Thermosulfidibacter takaii]